MPDCAAGNDNEATGDISTVLVKACLFHDTVELIAGNHPVTILICLAYHFLEIFEF